MASTVTKTGPFYTTAGSPISFSSLRTNFKESSSGSMKVSELRRNTTKSSSNPVVPDATENSSISTLNNLKLSQFRNSIKYYYITQTGTDLNYDIDAQNWNANLNKNIRKWMYVNGTCGSNTTGAYAAIQDAEAWNLTVDISGIIFGAKGAKGTKASPNASNGGGALYTQSSGGTITVNVQSGARIYSGGGGGAGGKDGTTGAGGACYNRVTYAVSGYCGGCSGCGGGFTVNCSGQNYSSYGAQRIGGCTRERGCACWFGWYRGWNCRNTKYTNPTCERYDPYCVPGAPGGVGSDGIDGRGYDNQTNSLTGATRTSGTAGGCPSYGGSGTDGIAGGNGGDWGLSGSSTSSGSAGSSGRAIGPSGGNYSVSGTINSNTVRGLFNP